MAFIMNDDGSIALIQGDSGTITVSGLPMDANYSVYFAIQDGSRNFVGEELVVEANMSDTVTFELTPALTDLLTVAVGKATQLYTYGIKICNTETGTEDTLIIADGDISSINKITVYPKKVEGLI